MQKTNALNFNVLLRLADMQKAQKSNYLKLIDRYAPTDPNQIFTAKVKDLANLFVGRSGNPHYKIPYYNMEALQLGGLVDFKKCGHKGFKFRFPLCNSRNGNESSSAEPRVKNLENQEFLIVRLADAVELDELSKLASENRLKEYCLHLFLKNSKNNNSSPLSEGSGTMKGKHERKNCSR